MHCLNISSDKQYRIYPFQIVYFFLLNLSYLYHWDTQIQNLLISLGCVVYHVLLSIYINLTCFYVTYYYYFMSSSSKSYYFFWAYDNIFFIELSFQLFINLNFSKDYEYMCFYSAISTVIYWTCFQCLFSNSSTFHYFVQLLIKCQSLVMLHKSYYLAQDSSSRSSLLYS